jgi:hypothetical protein
LPQFQAQAGGLRKVYREEKQMNHHESRRYEMLRRVRDFGQAHAADFPASSLGGSLFAAIGATVAELEQAASAQTSSAGSSRQGTESKDLAREALLDEMEAITATARAMALDNPGLENKFRIPRNASDQEVLTTARAFLADATPLAGEFIRHEMPADFLDQLRDAIAELEQAISERNHHREGRVSSRAALGEVIARGMKQVKQLNAVVRNKYRNDAATLAGWTSASHVEQQPRRKPSAPAAPPSEPGTPQA